MAGETQKICAELAHMKKEDLLVEHFKLSSITIVAGAQRRENADQVCYIEPKAEEFRKWDLTSANLDSDARIMP